MRPKLSNLRLVVRAELNNATFQLFNLPNGSAFGVNEPFILHAQVSALSVLLINAIVALNKFFLELHASTLFVRVRLGALVDLSPHVIHDLLVDLAWCFVRFRQRLHRLVGVRGTLLASGLLLSFVV